MAFDTELFLLLYCYFAILRGVALVFPAENAKWFSLRAASETSSSLASIAKMPTAGGIEIPSALLLLVWSAVLNFVLCVVHCLRLHLTGVAEEGSSSFPVPELFCFSKTQICVGSAELLHFIEEFLD